MNVVAPLTASAFDAACAPVSKLTLDGLLPGARAAVVVGSGGPAFFDRFASGSAEAGDGAPHPLDRYTKRVADAAAADALTPLGVRHAVYFPFDGADHVISGGGGWGPPPSPLPNPPALVRGEQSSPAPHAVIPFQRLGRVIGLGGPGPLGLQIHPVFGPWWAYRALVVVDRDLAARPPIGDGCAGCDAPCVGACPAHAVARAGFSVAACHARRLAAEPCRLSCAARIACIRGPEHQYTDGELAFHMAASMPKPKRLPPG